MKNMRKFISCSLILSLCLLLVPLSASASVRYSDVPLDSWYRECVAYCAENKIMIGLDEEHFGPENTITRGEFVTALHRLAGSPESVQENQFSDVQKDSYYAAAVLWGTENKIVFGMSETVFSPNQPITREDMACLIARYVQFIDAPFLNDGIIAELHFNDLDKVSSYAKESVDIMRHEELMLGGYGGMFNPQDDSTRAEVAMVFMRLQRQIAGVQPAVLNVYDKESGETVQQYTLTDEETAALRRLLVRDVESWKKETFVPEYVGVYELIMDDVEYHFESLDGDPKESIRCVKVYGGESWGLCNSDGSVSKQVYELLAEVVG